MTKWLGICSLALLIGTAGCSSDNAKPNETTSDAGASKTGTKGEPSDAGTSKTETHPDSSASSASSVSVQVSAAKGGTVSLGSAALDIPAGSLSGDTEVTLTTVTPGADLPDSKTVTGMLYDFGPDGTTFDPPAMLSLPVEGTAGSGQTAVVSWLDETAGTWVDLDTTVSGGKASAPIAHFTKFVVRFRDSGTMPVDCSFSACGGDIVGTWSITSACVNDGKDAGANNPFGSACPEALLDVSLDATGTAIFRSDGTYETDIMGTPSLSLMVPPSCLTSGHLPVSDCAALGKALGADGGVTCSGDTNTGCTCAGSAGKFSNDHTTGTYTVDGDTLTTVKVFEGGTETGDPAPFCVSGNMLKVKAGDGSVIYATKK